MSKGKEMRSTVPDTFSKNMGSLQAYPCAFSYTDALKSAVPCSLPSRSRHSHHMVWHNSSDWFPSVDTVLVLHVSSVVSPGMLLHTHIDVLVFR